MELEKYHAGEIRPNHISAIPDDRLRDYTFVNPDIRRCCGFRFARWLQEMFAHEYERRHSGGAIERRSFEVPTFEPSELAKIRRFVALRTYQPDDALFWDELSAHIEDQTTIRLREYAERLESE